jgi:hypothetical protein
MKNQIWFETDLGYAATKEKLLKSKDFIGDPSGDNRGRLTFHLKGLKDFTIQVTTKGKLGITYLEGSRFAVVLDKLRPFLVKADNSSAKFLRVIHNKASSNEQHSKLGFLNFLKKRPSRRDREQDLTIRGIDCEIAILLEEMDLDPNDPDYFKKINEIELKYQREYGLIP